MSKDIGKILSPLFFSDFFPVGNGCSDIVYTCFSPKTEKWAFFQRHAKFDKFAKGLTPLIFIESSFIIAQIVRLDELFKIKQVAIQYLLI